MSSRVKEQLDRARQDLLDLTARNRLINTPLLRGRTTRLDVIDESTAEVFRLLVQEKKELSFQPVPDVEEENEAESEVGDVESADAEKDADIDAELETNSAETKHPQVETPDLQDLPHEVATPSIDSPQPSSQFEPSAKRPPNTLQTPLHEEPLQDRLLKLYYDARSFFEEQGVSSLYLALGFLEWYEADNSHQPRYAPLILIPVELNRKAVTSQFRIKYLASEVTTNLSLQEKLKHDFSINLPDLPDLDELNTDVYFEQVAQVISLKPNWKLHRNRMTLWFFSFAKFLMFRDLDVTVWPEMSGPIGHKIIEGLLGDDFKFAPPLLGEHESLDQRFSVSQFCHVVDCDSSQAAAIEEVRAGRNLVVQGPPGTGKSQSIANMVASAVRDGKSVLFVAEKLAALQVVKSRLDKIGLGDICLELHSSKANRKAVLEELDRTLHLGSPKKLDFARAAEELEQIRDQLNRYVTELHWPIEHIGTTPYEMIGRYCRLQAKGVTRLNARIDGLNQWSAQDIASAENAIQDILELAGAVGSFKQHPLRAIKRTDSVMHSEQREFPKRLEAIIGLVTQSQEQVGNLAKTLSVSWQSEKETFQSAERVAKLCLKLRSMPDLDRLAYSNEGWNQHSKELASIVELGMEYERLKHELAPVFKSEHLFQPVTQLIASLERYGTSMFRWFQPGWYRTRKQVKQLCLQLPPSVEQQISLLRQVERLQYLKDQLTDPTRSGLAKAMFGSKWQALESNWQSLSEIVQWDRDCREANLPSVYRKVVAKLALRDADALSTKPSAVLKETWETLRQLCKEFAIDENLAFEKSIKDASFEQIIQTLKTWCEASSGLEPWIRLQRKLAEFDRLNLSELRRELELEGVDSDTVDRLRLMHCEAVMRDVLKQFPALNNFDGVTQSRLVAQFKKLDEQQLKLNRVELATQHYQTVPKGGESGEIGIVHGEIRKKRNQRSLRKLLGEAGAAVQRIKPVFMMSPTSVAQFLEPGKLIFDLLLIDEASQVKPVEALGAIIRSKQVVVVGDNKQLPPSSFFDRVVNEEQVADDDEDSRSDVKDVESVLDLCVARGFPERMLRWHYRSRHDSLIAVSNHEFYGNGLFIVPSPAPVRANFGLSLRHIPNAVYDKGGSRRNVIEAHAVASAMIEHARMFPNLSLGVGAFSTAQKDAILDELELLRRQHPETEQFFANTNTPEPWFVKNLENIQGDERDVIFISVGYGKDKHGRVAMSFGPLNNAGGERRLNVLITRAKEQCVVFSSITSDDIDLSRTNARGVHALKTYLNFADKRVIDRPRNSDRDVDSEFEAQVRDVLLNHGWQVDVQVGMAGFFIDLAVIDPKTPGRYLVGIECDGASYHSSRWARDRDRLRQAILEDHHWTIYRIWSTDWFHSQNEQVEKLLSFLNAQLEVRTTEATKSDDPVVPEPESTGEVVDQSSSSANVDLGEDIERVELGDEADGHQSDDYVEASFSDPLMVKGIDELQPAQLATIVVRIAQIEGPIHSDELARRVSGLWGKSRTGNRINAAVQKALDTAVDRKMLVRQDQFVHHIEQTEFSIRNRSNVTSANLRKPEMIASQEIASAIRKFLLLHVAGTSEDIIKSVARQFGFKATSQQLRGRILEVCNEMIRSEALNDQGGSLRIR